jgi:glycine cleavage system H protein
VNVPDDRRYTEEHEWALAEDGRVRIGITDYAQEELLEIVLVELPEVGRRAQVGEIVVEVHSPKSVAEVYAPLSGVVAAVNEALADDPGLVNRDPYGAGWLIVMEADDPAALDNLLAAAAYRALIG